MQKKATEASLPPAGVPFAASQKMGNARNSLRSNNGHFLIHFLPRSKGIDTSEQQKANNNAAKIHAFKAYSVTTSRRSTLI
ncbi:hypothetical protein [Undibacterium sp. TS12]|uniref:hypothetical protein n=1 Tax=Undibacterium sp. TS12 TaxID=2908202 RepID=UPI001F4CCE5A|nr:hypothetical protein [Undibacterium sp. TS12]MCH8622297.1 hypothetical protein [Undibacterium sp. TS12]